MTAIIILCAVGAIIVITAALCLYFLYKDGNRAAPQHIDHANSFIQARGTALYDGEGNIIQLKGVNLGNWFIQEPWMSVADVGRFDTGVYTQRRGREAMKANPALTDGQADELEQIYIQSYIDERDFKTIADLGMNVVRIPFSYMNLEKDGRLGDGAFDALDRAVELCRKNGLYAILDLHGGHGSQNMDHHSGDDAHFDLYFSENNRRATVELWKQIARHYCGNRTVAGYDLLNEPRRKPHRYGGRINFDYYDTLYRAVRAEDPDHLIFIECFSFPVNGARIKKYGWKNICMEYHIYNLTPFSQKTCLNMYRMMHNFMAYKTPVFIGEWNAYGREKDWLTYFKYFDKMGWSFCSWTYKTNAYKYRRDKQFKNLYVRTHKGSENLNWGMFELDMPTVDISSATYEEISKAYRAAKTDNAERSGACKFWRDYLNGQHGD